MVKSRHQDAGSENSSKQTLHILRAENRRLRKENKALRKENTRLGARYSEMEDTLSGDDSELLVPTPELSSKCSACSTGKLRILVLSSPLDVVTLEKCDGCSYKKTISKVRKK